MGPLKFSSLFHSLIATRFVTYAPRTCEGYSLHGFVNEHSSGEHPQELLLAGTLLVCILYACIIMGEHFLERVSSGTINITIYNVSERGFFSPIGP